MAKSAYDAALLLEVIAGFDERDNASAHLVSRAPPLCPRVDPMLSLLPAYAAIDHVQTNYTQFASGECVDFAKYRLGV